MVERRKPLVTILSVSFSIDIYTSGGSWRCAPGGNCCQICLNTTTTQRYEISVCEALIKGLIPPAASIYYLLVNYNVSCTFTVPASTPPAQCFCVF